MKSEERGYFYCIGMFDFGFDFEINLFVFFSCYVNALIN